ncbi:spermatogenesis-associated protein 31H1-like [Emydura macquarii macquarii]|uniref:spermatogenesis-associated protein 31H1-like n=1 Tax=Emydura macquarii macquarii TaxID=1129001 RepID=UPI00352A76B8
MDMPMPPSPPRPRVPVLASRGKPVLGYPGGWRTRDSRSPPRRSSRRDSESSPPSTDQDLLSASTPRHWGQSQSSRWSRHSFASCGDWSSESRHRSPARTIAPAKTGETRHPTTPVRSSVWSPSNHSQHQSRSRHRSPLLRQSHSPKVTRHQFHLPNYSRLPRDTRRRSRSPRRSHSPRDTRHRSPSPIQVPGPSVPRHERRSRSPVRSPAWILVAERTQTFQHQSRSSV